MYHGSVHQAAFYLLRLRLEDFQICTLFGLQAITLKVIFLIPEYAILYHPYQKYLELDLSLSNGFCYCSILLMLCKLFDLSVVYCFVNDKVLE